MDRAAGGSLARCCTPEAMLLVVGSAVALLAVGGFLVGLGRTVWLLARAGRRLRRLEPAAWPVGLQQAVARTGVGRVVCVASSDATAVCAGVLRPTIYVSPALVERLGPDELDAVLHHEADHARRREPLRRVIRQALAEAFFYLPLLRWRSRRRMEDAELAADRFAVARVGRGALARALLALGSSAPVAAAAFDGAAALRVAQLLDQPLSRRRPPAWTWALSGAGLGAAVALALCPAMGLR